MQFCSHCLQLEEAHHPLCPVYGESPEYESGKGFGVNSVPLTSIPLNLQVSAFMLGYAAGRAQAERQQISNREHSAKRDLERKLFQDRMASTRTVGSLIHRDPSLHPTDLASRVIQGGSPKDWMLRASYCESLGRWITVPYDGKGIYCVSSLDPHWGWEVLKIIGVNDKKSVLFVEPRMLVDAYV